MIGQATARFEPFWKRRLQSVFGTTYIGARQKWKAVWPRLRTLPAGPLDLLDAGCGTGTWSLEIAARRPEWSVTGIDKNAENVAKAEQLRSELRLGNVHFTTDDFLGFVPKRRFDVVLSVFSAHYLAEQGSGQELFSRFRSWLNPGGRLFLLGPRPRSDSSYVDWLEHPTSHTVFSKAELSNLCETAGLSVEQLIPVLSRVGAVAQQLCSDRRSLLGRGCLFPLHLLLSSIDARRDPQKIQRSAWWMLVARSNCLD